MRLHSKLIVAAFAATMLLAIGVNGAGARSLSVNERNFELIWDEALGGTKTKLEFIDEGGHNVQCKVTLLGRFKENTIKKETSIDQGTINHGELSSCEGGTATIKTETMPWGLRYRSFVGTLPTITSISTGLIGARFKVENGSISCEAGTEANHPGVGIVESFSGAEPENITAERNNTIPLGEFLCSFVSPSRFGGVGLIRNLPRTAKIRITLI